MNPITLDDAIDTIQGELQHRNSVDHKLESWQGDGESNWYAWIDDGCGSIPGTGTGCGPTMRAAIVDLARQLARKR